MLTFCFRNVMLFGGAVLLGGVVSGCSGEQETKGMSRIEGLPVAKDQPAMAAPPVAAGAGAGMAGDPAAAAGNIPSHTAGPLPGAHVHGADENTSGSDEAPMIQAGQTKVMAGGNILQAAGLAFTTDDAWKNIKPSSTMRVAQYQLEGSGGPAEMAIFYFGKGQGGGIEDNIKRWAAQFTPDAADPGTTDTGGFQVARLQKDDLRMALVKTTGTYDPGSMGPMGPPSSGPKPNYALFGLVVEGGPEGSLFIKVTGPKATMAEQDKALQDFAQSVRVSGFK